MNNKQIIYLYLTIKICYWPIVYYIVDEKSKT